jgi:hypothetical protein
MIPVEAAVAATRIALRRVEIAQRHAMGTARKADLRGAERALWECEGAARDAKEAARDAECAR